VRQFCSYIGQAPQKMSTVSILEERGQKCVGDGLQKHVAGTARQRGRGERDRDALTVGELELRRFLYIPL